MHRPVSGYLRGGPQRFLQETPERRLRHLAGSHRELPVPAFGVGMAADPHIVGRVEESDIDQVALADHLAQELGSRLSPQPMTCSPSRQMSPGLVRAVAGTGGIRSSNYPRTRLGQQM